MLTDERIDDIQFKYQNTCIGFQWLEFARAIEAEARKQDTALIRQLVDALERVDAAMPFPAGSQAIKAGRARLENNQ